MNKYSFECGCKIDITNPEIKKCDNLPGMKIDFQKLNYNCPITWDLFASGKTKGIFQLEKGLGKTWSKRSKPTSIEDISALVSLIRPGTLSSFLDGKSMTQHYVDRKMGNEEVIYIHPALELILNTTFAINVYQEQTLKIASVIAGFDMQKADSLRKAIGKKDAKLMKSIEQDFIDGCINTGLVDKDTAIQLFDNIEKSNKYSFNKCILGSEKLYNHINTIEELYCLQSLEGYQIPDTYSIDNSNNIYNNKVKNISCAGYKHVLTITLENGANIAVTKNHKFPTKYGTILAKDLKIGDFLKYLDKTDISTEIIELKITKLEKSEKKYTVYDVTMECPYHNFITSEGIVTCNSHAVGYSEVSFWTAYAKAHFPLHFCCSYLHYAREKMFPQKEVEEILVDAKDIDVDILTPDIRLLFNGDHGDFSINGGKINFGVRSIKGCGDSNINKLLKLVEEKEKELDKSISEWTWLELLMFLLVEINKTVSNGVISVGACSHFGFSRQEMLYQYNIASGFTDKEVKLIKKNIHSLSNLQECLDLVEQQCRTSRLNKIKELKNNIINPPFSLEDNPTWIAEKEQYYLGSAISCTKSETVNHTGNTSCKEFNNGKDIKNITLVGEIKSIREFVLKNGNLSGQKICFGTLQDSTGTTDFVLSVDKYKEYKNVVYQSNIVMLSGKRGKNDNIQVDRMATI